MSPKFGFFKRKTSDYFQDKKSDSDSVQSVTDKELLEIKENGKKVFDTSQPLLGEGSESTSQSASSSLGEGETNGNTSQRVVTSQVQNNNQNIIIDNKIQTEQRLQSIILEEEGEKPIPLEEQKKD